MAAETVAKALGGSRTGRGWMARCPAHDDRVPSLSLTDSKDGKLLVYCHAGCKQRDVIDALRSRGLLPSHSRRGRASTRDRIDERTRDAPEHAEEMSAVALRIWQNSAPAPGTKAEVYLHARGIVLPIPSSLRFHPGLKHSSGSFWPTMVALVTNGITDRPQAIHRTFLMLDGSDKAPVEPTKMMLGPCQAGAVRLGPVSEHLLIGEGIETCLSAMQATGIPAWAALSTSGLTALGLPPEVRQVTILADGEDAGEKAAQSTARRWVREGRRVRIARAGWGLDFNDLLVGRRPEIEEIAE